MGGEVVTIAQIASIIGSLFQVPVVVFMYFTMRRQDQYDKLQRITSDRLDAQWREIDRTIDRVARLERKP